MKIAVFVHYLPPHIGGIEVVAEGQIMALAAAGQDISVITSACNSKSGLIESDGYTVRRIPAWNYFEERMGAVFPIYSPALIWHGYRAVKQSDVVHAHDAFYLTSLIATFWARILHKPLILTQHVDMVPHSNKFVNLMQKLVYATTGRFVLMSSNKIIVLNSRVRAFLTDIGIDGSIITYLPNAVDTGKFSPPTEQQKRALRNKYSLPNDKILALFVGRFVPKKGFTKLLELETVKDLELVFAGGGAPAGHTRDDQHFLGPIDRNEVADVFKLCDVFVLPSQGEGFPVTVQEAMACGLPIIMGDDSAYEPYMLDTSLVKLIEPDTEPISIALRATVEDSKLRQDMARYSRQYALQHFDGSAHMMQLLSIYESQIASKRVPCDEFRLSRPEAGP
jgi:D-inositol-3-phosphate glycosyltransferase